MHNPQLNRSRFSRVVAAAVVPPIKEHLTHQHHRTLWSLAGAATLLMACGGEDPSSLAANGIDTDVEGEELVLGTSEQALCQNDGGVNGVLAAIAVASANEMRRWLPTRDFQWNSSTGMLELSKYALPRCRDIASTVGCPNTKALLDMQSASANGKVVFPDGVRLDSARLRQTLKTYWNSQVACNNAGNCPVDYHDLKFHHTENGPCGTRFFYDAFEMNTRTPLTAEHANRFSNQLLFLGHPSNPFLAYSVQNDRASVDPTYGLTATSTTSSGRCTAACTMVSNSNVAGQCCSCKGVSRRFSTATWNRNTYLCQ
jgi:hypothetical protein